MTTKTIVNIDGTDYVKQADGTFAPVTASPAPKKASKKEPKVVEVKVTKKLLDSLEESRPLDFTGYTSVKLGTKASMVGQIVERKTASKEGKAYQVVITGVKDGRTLIGMSAYHKVGQKPYEYKLGVLFHKAS